MRGLPQIGGFVALAVTWEVLARLAQSPAFPPVSVVLAAWVTLAQAGLWPHILTSLHIIGIGFAIAAVFGFVLGVLAAQSRVARALILPPVDAVRGVSALAMLPALVVILGLGIWSKASVIFWTAWPGILLSTLYGIHHVDQYVVEAAIVDGADRFALLRFITLPLSAGAVLTGLRIGLGGGWISLIAAEMLGSQRGLGFLVLAESQTFHFPEMYAAILTIALVGLVMNTALLKTQDILEWRLYHASIRSGSSARRFARGVRVAGYGPAGR